MSALWLWADPTLGAPMSARITRLFVNGQEIYRADAIEQHPVEDPLDDPTKQVPDVDLPAQVEGNDDTEEGEEQE